MKKIGDDDLTDAFGKVIEEIKNFVMPMLRPLARGQKFTQQWKAGSGWMASKNAKEDR